MQANSWQVLKYQAPQAALVVLCITPLFDNVNNQEEGAGVSLISYLQDPPPYAMLILLASAVLAFCVNLSIFLVVGKTNPVVYNVLGHFKLLVILSGGLVFQNEDRNPIRLLGMTLAFAGIVKYTDLKQTMGNTAWGQKKEEENLQQPAGLASSAANKV